MGSEEEWKKGLVDVHDGEHIRGESRLDFGKVKLGCRDSVVYDIELKVNRAILRDVITSSCIVH